MYNYLFILIILILNACTLRPILYKNKSLNNISIKEKQDIADKLSMIYVLPVDNRIKQIIRNNLIYLFGINNQKNTKYKLLFNINENNIKSISVNIDRNINHYQIYNSSTTIVMNANYKLYDINNNVIIHGSLSSSASYERILQEYSNLSAEDDARERAANELSDNIYYSVIQYFYKKKY